MRMIGRVGAALALCLAAACGERPAAPPAGELNLYSTRHYDGDEALYALFSERTGVKINRIEGKGDEILARLKAEGAASPADVLLTVDAGNLWRAEQDGLLQPVRSAALTAAIPAALRDPEGEWFGVAKRARVIVYDPARTPAAQVQTYEQLADPALKGKVCVRSSSNIYNLSMMAALIERIGAPAAEAWARGVVANFARAPEGGDTDQIRAVAAGQCAVALVNHYYLARLKASATPEDQAVAAKVAVVFPNQATSGTHVNVTGAGVAAHAPNRAEAVRFIEFLATPEAQALLAASNFEYPVLAGAAHNLKVLADLGAFTEDPTPLTVYGARQAEAQQVFDRAGWR